MVVLAFAWIGLVIYQLATGPNRLINDISTVIWVIFIGDFTLRFAVAPDKTRFLQRNWLQVLALVLPGFRVLPAARLLGLVRAAPFFRLTFAVHRGARALGHTLGRSGAAYVLSLTVIVAFAGAAGMYASEGYSRTGSGFAGFADALWWTAMILTTMGSSYWPHTMLGRVLCLTLAVYGFSIFGYVTAIFAKFLVQEKPGPDSVSAQIAALRRDMHALTAAVRDGGGAGGAGPAHGRQAQVPAQDPEGRLGGQPP